MAFIQLDNVSVELPVYDSSSRSIKTRLLSSPVGGQIASPGGHGTNIKALNGVTAVAKHGSRVGLIGHNGAGKSTLLRVLAGIYEPTAGSVRVDGEVAPLFDVSLGMDYDATGYENIKLRGLFLGLSKTEIEAKTDDIIEFTGLGNFLALPVRTYSAGMKLRLAFSISTSIDPDILLIDEGIAAGDSEFIEKANRRLRNFADRASIIVLASHSAQLISDICNHVVLMEHGRILATGKTTTMLRQYADRAGVSRP